MLARILGASLEGSARLQEQIIEALQPYDEQRKVELSQQLPAMVIEALLVLLHKNRVQASVGEIADLTNAILVGRRETVQLSAKKVGGILRKLGIYAERQGPGFQLTFTAALRSRTYELACAYGALSLLNFHDVHDVHDVHNAHDVQANAEAVDAANSSERDPEDEVYDGPPHDINLSRDVGDGDELM